MNSIVKIFQIISNKEYIDLSEISLYEIKEFGNGFFISEEGHIASVGHVMKEDNITTKEINSYALFNNKLQKTRIIKSDITEKNQDHIDIAIGKINTNQKINFIEKDQFEEVSENMPVKLIGYSRFRNGSIENNVIDTELIELKSLCFFEDSPSEGVTMHNFFSFVLNNNNLKGLSGSPIINNNNNVVGVLKGGRLSGNKTICIALKIKKFFDYI